MLPEVTHVPTVLDDLQSRGPGKPKAAPVDGSKKSIAGSIPPCEHLQHSPVLFLRGGALALATHCPSVWNRVPINLREKRKQPLAQQGSLEAFAQASRKLLQPQIKDSKKRYTLHEKARRDVTFKHWSEKSVMAVVLPADMHQALKLAHARSSLSCRVPSTPKSSQ